MCFSRIVYCVLLSLLWGALNVFGLGAHELLVIANRNDPVSVRIARHYMHQRHVPRQNLVLLNILPDDDGNYLSIGRDAFTKQIWEPVCRAISQRNLEHVLAWVFSTHIPFRVDSSPPVSVQGLVFVRNRNLSHDEIARAVYASPLFVGPSRPDDVLLPPRSIQIAAKSLRDDMPIPAMALGYIGPRGNTESEVMEMLEKSIAADTSSPSGSVFFVTGNDIRAQAREWQFHRVQDQLQKMGMDAVITNQLPRRAESILGIMMGTRHVEPDQIGNFIPGAVAEHLTSYGAFFDNPSQTKISRWIAAGATGTAGTVTEPYAVWAKFLHARFYMHYRSGYSLLESYYLSLRHPLQSFLIGDPLMRPWAPQARLQIAGLRNQEMLRTPREIRVDITAPAGVRYDRVVYLINGLIAGEGRQFRLDPATLEPGLYELRAVGYRAGLVSTPISDMVQFQIGP